MPQLQVLSGNRLGFVLDVADGEVVDIGNRKTAKLSIRDPWISWNHARIWTDSGKWVLEDVGSSNGTWVNGEKVKRKELKGNDVIHFGKTKVKFVGAGGAAAAEKPAPEKPAAGEKPASSDGQPWWDKVIEGGAAGGGGGDGAAWKQLEAQVRDERRMREALERFLDLPRGAQVGDVAKAGALERRVKELELELADAKGRLAAPRVDNDALEKQRQEHSKALVELEAKSAAADARALGLEKRLETKAEQAKKELDRAREKADEELAELRKALEDARKTAGEVSSGGDKAMAAARDEAQRLAKELDTQRQRVHDAERQLEELRAQLEATPKGADPAELERLNTALAEAQAKAAQWEEEHKKVVQEIDEISMEQIEIEDGLKAQVRELKLRLGEPVDDGAEATG